MRLARHAVAPAVAGAPLPPVVELTMSRADGSAGRGRVARRREAAGIWSRPVNERYGKMREGVARQSIVRRRSNIMQKEERPCPKAETQLRER